MSPPPSSSAESKQKLEDCSSVGPVPRPEATTHTTELGQTHKTEPQHSILMEGERVDTTTQMLVLIPGSRQV